MDFLYMVYAYNKNFELRKFEYADDGQLNPSEGDMLDEYRTFTYDWLIKRIMEYCEDDPAGIESRISAIAGWGFKSNENYMKALLTNR